MSNITKSYIDNPHPSPRAKSDNPAGGEVPVSQYTKGPAPKNPLARGNIAKGK